MAQIRVEQIEDLGIVTDENDVKHIVIGSETITPITNIDMMNSNENNDENVEEK